MSRNMQMVLCCANFLAQAHTIVLN